MENSNDKSVEYDLGTYKRYTRKSEMDKALHTLEGIIKGISIDGLINDKEVQALLLWCGHYKNDIKKDPINEVIKLIRNSIEDGVLDESEKQDILWLSNNFKTDNIYFDYITSEIQKLQGMLHGIVSDGVISDTEIKLLKEWIEDNDHLIGSYPYDEINSILVAILADGKVDDNERKILRLFLSDFVDKKVSSNLNKSELEILKKEIHIDGICVMCPEVILTNHIFCFTGESERSTRKEISNTISSLGGIYKNNVSSKTNYLIIGNEGNKCWSFSCYGRKVEQAVNMRREGKNIIIVHENDFWDAVEDAI